MTRALTIPLLFENAVQQHGEREALVFRDTRWTYRQLAERVAAGRSVLRQLAGNIPHRVAIIGANHAAYAVAYFAAQTAGATTVEIGRDESLAIITDTLAANGTEVVITDRDDVANAVNVPAITFEELLLTCEARLAQPAPHKSPELSGDALASIVYTSGTTGSPKGVMLSHGNVLFVVHAVCDYLDLRADDRYAIVLPLAHTYGKSNLLSVVAAGATAVFIENPQQPAVFFGSMMAEDCTVLSVVPFHLNVLARRGLPPGVQLTNLRAVTTSGGPLPDAAVQAVKEWLPNAELFSMYGLTESSTRACYLPPTWLAAKRGSVGRPLPGMSLEIRDDQGRELPAGVVGHVFLRGPNIMQGYYGDPQLTEQTLLDGWLRTGDIGYVDADGCLYLTGREKEIIKVAGERISPAEIEEILLAHPAVAEAAVVGAPDPLLGETVWAYVILNPAGTDTNDLFAFCAERLSPHKVPRRIEEVEKIPRTPTGKIRRHLLNPRAVR